MKKYLRLKINDFVTFRCEGKFNSRTAESKPIPIQLPDASIADLIKEPVTCTVEQPGEAPRTGMLTPGGAGRPFMLQLNQTSGFKE